MRRLKAMGAGVILGGVLALGLGHALSSSSGGPASVRPELHIAESTWRKAEAGLEVVTAELEAGSSPRGRLVALYIEPARFDLRLHLNPELRPLEAWLGAASVVANAGYFTHERKPTGLLVSGGEILHPFVARAGGAGSGVFILDARGPRLVERDAVEAEDYADAELAIQAGPRVIEPGSRPGIRSDDGRRANRTVIGTDSAGRVVIAVVHDAGVGRGATLYELQRLLGEEGLGRIDDRLALTSALNLDGGPSTGLHTRSPAPDLNLGAASRVVSVLTVAPRQR